MVLVIQLAIIVVPHDGHWDYGMVVSSVTVVFGGVLTSKRE